MIAKYEIHLIKLTHNIWFGKDTVLYCHPLNGVFLKIVYSCNNNFINWINNVFPPYFISDRWMKMNLYLWVSLTTSSLELLWIKLGILNYSQPFRNRQRKQGLFIIHRGFLSSFSCMKLSESDMVSMQDEVLRLHKSNEVFYIICYRVQIIFTKNVFWNWTDVIFKAYVDILIGNC